MRALTLLALSSLLACTTQTARPATEGDLFRLAMTLTKAEGPSQTDALVGQALLQTLTELDLGRSEKCRDWLTSVEIVGVPAGRAYALKKAAEECHFPCAPNGFESLSTAKIAERCGNDPLLPSLTPAERDALSPLAYVWLRGLVEETRIGLSRMSNPKAHLVDEKLSEQLPRALKSPIARERF
jgi:hypothetical protein